MNDLIYLNFYVVSILIGTVFYMVVGAFIFAAIPDKSRATFHLGFAYLFSSLLAFAYVPGYSIYHPLAAYHRWLTVPAALLAHPHYAQVFYYFPDKKFGRAAKIILILQYVLAFALTAIFIHGTFSREMVYSFSGHFWDFDADDLSKLVGLGIILNILHVIVAGITHIVARKGRRLAVAGIFLGMLTALLVPTTTNLLSRDGLISRDTHQTLLILMSIMGLFTVLVVYLNNTQDKTTFMLKIVGISLVTFMVVMVFISYFSFQDKEDAYDAVQAERTSRLAVEHDYPVADLKYLTVYDLQTGKQEILSGKSNAQAIDFSDVRIESSNTAAYERIKELKGPDWRKGIEDALKDTTEEFAGYAGLIRKLAPRSVSPQQLLAAVENKSQQITYRSIKIKEIPDKEFRKQLTAYVDKMPADLSPFADAIKSHVDAHPESDGAQLKHEVNHFFSPFRPEEARRYRRDPQNHHFTAFMKYDAKHHAMYEAGFSYATYRQFIHHVGFKIALMFISVVLVIIFGFRVFFLGTLVRPLEALLSGVRKVNKGDLSVEVRVAVPDEIGFLTESFNSMVSSIRVARQKLERYADELEDKVRERTAELTETLQTVQALKSQQDGDYFLTSLLIKPLARNVVRSENVHVEFLIEQKKKFEFRKWKEEIGGDFCAAHSIELMGKTYTCVVNADAMGKSIQGAGGALVLGAVFESILERGRSVPAFKEQSPERWVKSAFQELQGIFESFDGSMLISMVLGLVDDETGLFYYVNVEHPWTVLFRKDKAAFVETEHHFRKLGVAGLDGQIKVQTFQLEPEDVLILGSDGRDDLLLGTAASGERIINEDEFLFLRMTELGHGRLPEIRSHLEEQGPLTDDLSLIRIAYRTHGDVSEPDKELHIAEYREKAKALMEQHSFTEAAAVMNEALQLDPKSLKSIRIMVRLFMDQKDYERAIAHVEDYIYLRPLDTDMIYLASYVCKKLKRLSDAAEFGERVRLRSPDFVRNLLNLAEVYARLGNRDRAQKILREVIKLEPENKKALKLGEMIGNSA